ncbi:cystathionine gamma-synthase [Geosmithia morbida]|uniref:cystathionine gamma-synthase n=1 Tax=Geosmithia morbida TaxID=1094350 RepID=A0A9P5D4K5_9HYPO|nr:cystathionine gamma-synthase [Geosmithia morbida]KAF4121579.1 cystathionine gamma-synthase [Geosmithia morbida]
MPSFEVGESIPLDTAHAVSVSLPTWQSNIGYEEGQEWVTSRMVTGYPRLYVRLTHCVARFFIHKSIQAFAADIAARHGLAGQNAMLFPSVRSAGRCLEFIRERAPPDILSFLSVVNLALDSSRKLSLMLSQLAPTISAVIYPESCQPLAKQYWQHSGDGVSSRRAEFCHDLFRDGILVVRPCSPETSPGTTSRPFRGPKRYQRGGSIDGTTSTPKPSTPASPPGKPTVVDESRESKQFLEERFGRNLDLSLASRAKSAIRRRIAGTIVSDVDSDDDHKAADMATNTRGFSNLREDDVYLFPTGMNAIFNSHRVLLAARGAKKSINFGFPYVDTLKILQKFGPGCLFLGGGEDEDLDELEKTLKGGERFLALFCEFPGNPLLKCPNLQRIRKLADEFDFAVVVDETIGTFANINVLPVADIVVSSLTKIFSGDSNVMGGSAILNPNSRYYDSLKRFMATEVEDTYWPEDAIVLERNSRDFKSRVDRVNANAEAICDILRTHPLVKSLFYPKYNPSRPIYDSFRVPGAGYGGLISVVFHEPERAPAFYDALDVAKGPSLGTNFTLGSPYVILAHYCELEWAASFGVESSLVRLSVGLEETSGLQSVFWTALKAAENAKPVNGQGSTTAQ